MGKNDIGVIGLAVMGKNLALNIESRGFSVSVYNRTRAKTDEMVQETKDKKIYGTYSIEEFVNSLASPRKIIIMVKAGKPVDDMIEQLKAFISKGDILIDAGNSFYGDTMRRSRQLEAEGYRFIGTGVSGGEEGALHGPAIMPGGEKEVYKLVEPILTAIAAKVNGEPCCTYIGTDGAGHYVKMVHNGIEYGDMQLICEAYSLLKNVLGMTAKERLQPVELGPDMATLSTGSVNFGEDLFVNTMGDIRTFAQTMLARGVRPEIEAFDSGMVQNALALVREGTLQLPLHFDLVLGVPGAMPGTPEALMYMKSLLPAGSTWTVAGIGRAELALGTMAIILGGHVRVGFEDNIYYKKGQLAQSNAQLVERIVRLAGELGREVASPAEARKILYL